jgi:hypothetical protein
MKTRLIISFVAGLTFLGLGIYLGSYGHQWVTVPSQSIGRWLACKSKPQSPLAKTTQQASCTQDSAQSQLLASQLHYNLQQEYGVLEDLQEATWDCSCACAWLNAYAQKNAAKPRGIQQLKACLHANAYNYLEAQHSEQLAKGKKSRRSCRMYADTLMQMGSPVDPDAYHALHEAEWDDELQEL